MNDIKKLEQEIIDIKDKIKKLIEETNDTNIETKETEIPEKDGKYWSDILQINPERSNELSKNDWDKLNGWYWMKLLIRQPQLAKNCKWDKLDGSEWCWILRRQPQLIEYHDCDKLDESKCMNEYNWYDLLKIQPQLKEYQTKDMQIKIFINDIKKLEQEIINRKTASTRRTL